ncbi:12283_t:CDS:2 [Entrophospora sp. SA101]|nr:12283_t:CDS:2 [Entrophospora sp. SA101]
MHMASPAQKEILRCLVSFQEILPKDVIDSVLNSLLQLDPNYWDKKKVKGYCKRCSLQSYLLKGNTLHAVTVERFPNFGNYN